MSEARERNPRCPRCGGALKFETCIVGGDEMYAVEDEAVCMNCSRRFAQVKLLPALRVISMEEMRQHNGNYAAPEPRAPRSTKPCRVVECGNRVVYYSVSGLCAHCAKKMEIWGRSSSTKAVPFVPHPDVAEMLMLNPARSLQHVG